MYSITSESRLFDVNHIGSGAIHYFCSWNGLMVIYFIKNIINLHCLRKFIGLCRPRARYGSTNAKHDMQCTHSRNIVVRLCNYCWRRKAVNFTYSECVFLTLYNQHAKCTYRTILCVCVWLCNIFPHHLKHGTINRKECLNNKFCNLISSTKSFGNLSYSKKNSARCWAKYTSVCL